LANQYAFFTLINQFNFFYEKPDFVSILWGGANFICLSSLNTFPSMLKLAFMLILSFVLANAATACITGCVVDQCSERPFVKYPIRVYEPAANGGAGGIATIFTNSSGCFSYDGGIGATVTIAGVVYTDNGKSPCANIGTISVYGGTAVPIKGNLTGAMLVNGSPIYTGNPSNVAVNGYRVNGCLPENLLTFPSVSAAGLENLCYKIDIYHVKTGMLAFTMADYLPWNDVVPDINGFLAGQPRGTYEIKLRIKCCGAPTPKDVGNFTIFSGSFVWTPPVDVADATFRWIGSNITETQCGNSDLNIFDNAHPNDGKIYNLGMLTAGINGSIIPGSGSATLVKYSLFKLDAGCVAGGAPPIWTQTVSASAAAFNINFNSVTSLYFLNGFSNGAYTPNGGGQLGTCFRFEIEVFGPAGCPSTSTSGRFRICNQAFGRQANDKIIYEAEGALERSSGIVEQVILSPNPVSDLVNIISAEVPEHVQIYALDGKLVKEVYYSNQIDLSDCNGGVYLAKLHFAGGRTKESKLLKL
jgi:Secretion system C-terminal sorting domain